ncbi:MAG: OadG family protein [Firmicutes bacterium]|nr:OadG family protein [Bacillota bacterium]
MSFGNAVIYSLLGICVVFFALALLMCICLLILKFAGEKPAAQSTPAETAAEEKPEERPLAPGSAGDVKLYDTDPRDAAMIMAIIAEELKTPLNELRFKSIREVRE